MGQQAVFVRVREVAGLARPAPHEVTWGRDQAPAAEFSIGLWPPPGPTAAITAAVVAPSPAGAGRLAEVLESNGVVVAEALGTVDPEALDGLASNLDALVLAVGASEEVVERVMRALRGALDLAAIIVVCPRSMKRRFLRYLEWGADAIVFADELESTLTAAVRGAVAGQISVPQSMRHLLAPPALSQREKEVLELAARGLTNRQIADSLFLAESTVKTHLSTAFKRLGVNSRREASALICATDTAMRRLLLPAPPQTTNGGTTTGQTDNRQPPEGERHEHIQHA